MSEFILSKSVLYHSNLRFFILNAFEMLKVTLLLLENSFK
jgi:hypothetical protein